MNVFAWILSEIIEALFISGAEFTRKLLISQDTLDNWKKGKYMPSDGLSSKRCTINELIKQINDRYVKVLRSGTISSDEIIGILIKSGLPQQAKDELLTYAGNDDFPGKVLRAAYEYEKIKNDDGYTLTMVVENPVYPYLVRRINEGSDPTAKDKTEKINIDKRDFIIGRKNKNADYVCNNSFVSKNHAEIFVREGRYYLMDLGSTNGTFVNGKRIDKLVDTEIINNDKIKFADWEYTFVIPED
ncbi:MAG TPA: FHA domain-containing protein [Pseudobacteroides sp.]|uniref:FHA domain-containing protein n=1 Tax=Pseudobacteroides sp. TaxID=1968840 RepID=UPI002F94EA34